MLLRILVAVEDSRLRKRIVGLGPRIDAVMESVEGGAQLWRRASRESYDLIIVGERLLPQPMDDSTRSLSQLPEAPDVVLVTVDEPDSQLRAELLGAGCSVVIGPDLPERSYLELLEAVAARRCQSALDRSRHRGCTPQ